MVSWNIFPFFIIVIITHEVNGQLCNKTISVSREVPETYQYTYYEAYQDDGCLIWCTKSRQASNIGTKLVKKIVEETKTICCEGYTEDLFHNGDGLQCVPVCSPPCINGYCRKPNECACEWGFALDPNDTLNRCVPLCLEGCDLPDCLPTCAPHNFAIVEPLAACKNCNNGTCVAPGKCQCDNGFKLTDEGSCEPICSSCEHGTCLRPGLCTCDPGWREECGGCRPICSNCDHGNCTAPGQCECDAGYKSDDGKCVPFCSKGCINGSCIGPEICSCDPGWYMNEESSECLPHCDVACDNGSCVAPNVCQCDSGYEGPHCEPICINCEGFCLAPGVCRRDVQIETHTTVTGSECDCCDFFDFGRKCDNLICRNRSDEETVGMIKITNVTHDIGGVHIRSQELVPAEHDISNHTICQQTKTSELPYHWIYGAIIIAELLIIIIIIILISVMKSKYFFNRQFVPKQTSGEGATVRFTSSFK